MPRGSDLLNIADSPIGVFDSGIGGLTVAQELTRLLPDGSVDSIVTDPPYELGFMGKAWDNSGIAYLVPMWREALRVLKPHVGALHDKKALRPSPSRR